MENNISFDNLPQAVAKLLEDVCQIKRLLTERANDSQDPGEELLTIQQAAELLHLSVPTVYGLHHRRLLPGVCKTGKRLYFLKEGLLQYIKSGRKQSAKELADDAETHFKNANKKR